MRLRALLGAAPLALGAGAALAAPAGQARPAGGPAVGIGFASFSPADVAAVRGEAVTWTNTSARRHTVTAEDGSFDELASPGERVRRVFASDGSFAYRCTLHAGMFGQVDVYEALLDPVAVPAASRRPFPLHGRAAPGTAQVTVAGDDGSEVRAPVGPDGAFTAAVTPTATTVYTPRANGADGPPLTLRVLDRAVSARTSHRGRTWSVLTRVAPASPGQPVVLQLRLRDHFGWWPVARGRLDRASSVRLATRLRHRVAARVVLTLADGATALAFSRTFALG